LSKIFVGGYIIHADAQDPGVKSFIEIKISLMPIYLTRSDRGKGGREEGYDQMMLPVVISVVVYEFVLRRRKHECGGLISDFQSSPSIPQG
jgi:hypothetical protein